LLDEFEIPENHKIWCMAALGYPLNQGVLLAKKKMLFSMFEFIAYIKIYSPRK